MPFFQKIFAFLVNQLGEKHTFRIVATSQNYTGFEVLGGLIRYERGQKYEFYIHGTEKFAEIVLNYLIGAGLLITKKEIKD